MTSAIPVRCSTNWAMKPHIGREANLLSSFLPWGVKWCEVYMKEFIYLNCGCRSKWRMIIAVNFHIYCIAPVSRRSRVRIPLKPWFFQASSFQLLKLENLLRWSFFTLIYNRSSNIWILSYILHIIPKYYHDLQTVNKSNPSQVTLPNQNNCGATTIFLS